MVAGTWQGVQVAVKMMRLQTLGLPPSQALKQAIHEISTLVALSHPHLVSHLDTLLQPEVLHAAQAVGAQPVPVNGGIERVGGPHAMVQGAGVHPEQTVGSGTGTGERPRGEAAGGIGAVWRLCMVQVKCITKACLPSCMGQRAHNGRTRHPLHLMHDASVRAPACHVP